MNINKKQSNTRKIILVFALIVVLIGAGYTAAASSYSLWPFSPESKEIPMQTEDTSTSVAGKDDTTTDKTDDATAKEDTSSTEPQKGDDDSKDVDSSQNAEDVSSSTKAVVSITSLEAVDDTVTYQASVKGASNGTCSALFTSAIGKPVSDVSSVSNGICKANIPTLKFDSYGKWKLTLRFYNDNTQAKDDATLTLSQGN